MFIKNLEYGYTQLLDHADERAMVVKQHGPFHIGEQFIALVDDRDNVASFVLSGYTNESIWECIYTDFKLELVK